jgi:glycosyltransferase involved in cell wall biosynthesis
MSENKKLISIVIPCYNEEKNIDRTIEGLLDLEEKNDYSLEIIAVNDGSKDETWKVIRGLSNKHQNVVGINFMSNFGQSAAYQAGFDVASGEYVITVSADLEIPLENINEVINLLDAGYDFVNTHRVGRWGHEKASRQVKSNYANKFIAAISGVSMMDRGSGMKGFTKVLAQNLRFYGEMHRFIPDYVSVFGAKMTEFEVEFVDRDFGESAYKGHKRTIKVLLDLVTLFFLLYFARKPFWSMPGRIFGFTGALTAGMGSLAAFYLFVLKLMGESIGNRPLLILAVLMIIVGMQSMMMGMIGELLMRTYFESSGRKTYTVREKINGK